MPQPHAKCRIGQADQGELRRLASSSVTVWGGPAAVMGQKRLRLRQVRKAAGLTPEELAYRLGVDRSTVGRWEAGETEPLAWLRPKLAKLLGLTNRELAAVLGMQVAGQSTPSASSSLRLDGADWTQTSSRELVAVLSNLPDSPAGTDTMTRLVHEWLVIEPPQLIELQTGRRIGEALVSKVERRVAELRRMDDYVAGGDLHRLVEQELRATAGLLHEASYPEALGRRLLVAVGELCQLAGWVLSDAGAYAGATHYYSVGLKAAHAADNVPVAANLISTLSYQVSNVGQPHDAVLLAHSAVAGAGQQTRPTV